MVAKLAGLGITVLLLFGLLALLSLAAPGLADSLNQIAVDVSSSHGVDRHSSEALAVRNCLNERGANQVWENPTTGRRAQVCQIDTFTFGIQIIENHAGIWKEITAFVKNKMTNMGQVSNYLKNTGYRPIQ